jgi:hypothetical protein
MRTLSIAALAACCLLLSACQKRADFEVKCKILTITEKYRFNPADPLEITTYTFNYNQHGDPISAICSNPTTGKPNYHFVYDNKKRLIWSYGEYDPGNIEFFAKYYYTNNVITFDTTFYFGGDLNNPYPTFANYIVSRYTYDSKGRISRIDRKVSVNNQERFDEYNYDSNGNLANGSAYDNKVSYLRTNLVLAFFERDYSMNNPGTPLSYNFRNLPTSFSIDWKTDPQTYFQNTMVHEVTYDCGHSGHNW